MRRFQAFATTVAAVAALPAIAQDSAPVPSKIIARNELVVMKSYPPASMKRGEEGSVRFRIKTDRSGRLDACQVVKSSGYEALDKATCDMLLAGATATPLRSEDGWHVPGTRDGLVEWKLPAGVARPATPPPFTARVNSAGVPLVCKRQEKTGSLVASEKICLTAADWRRQSDYAQSQVRAMQAPQGPIPDSIN